MKRTKFKNDQSVMTMDSVKLETRMAIYSELLGRAQLASKLGYQYGGNRDVYQTLGYDKTPEYDDYYAKYERNDIAKAIINRPVKASWRGKVKIEQSGVDKTTPFEKAWRSLWKRLKLKSNFIRLDKLATLGQYAVLILGFDDVGSNGTRWNSPVSTDGQRELLYVRPVSQKSARIVELERTISNPRYGLPNVYDISLENADGSKAAKMQIHHSRILHVPGELLESEIYGQPALKSVYNRLYDLEKIVGGSAEMFWRGARPGYQGMVDKDFMLTDTAKQDLENQLDEFENNFRRFLINEGVKLSALEMQVADPRNHVLVQLQMISADTGIPIRILIGSERGELASTEDKTTWLELVQTRQEDYLEVQMLDPFIELCIKYQVLPKPGREPYKIIWPDLFSPSEKERAEIGRIRAAATQSYLNNPSTPMALPLEVFYEFFLGLTEEQFKHVKRLSATSTEEMIKAIMEKIGTGRGGANQGALPVDVGNEPSPTIHNE